MNDSINFQHDTSDSAMEEVAAELLRQDPDGMRWAGVVRRTYDMIYNGQETGRYQWSQLMKTEKTHFGTMFEINAQREFQFSGGDKTDFRIAGHEVDAKWSQIDGGWMLPPEVFDELALVATGNDRESCWSLGLIRVTEDVRRIKVNRDQKTQLNRLGRQSIRWLWRNTELRPNVLLTLSESAVEHIFDSIYGTQRTHRLFREAEGYIVHRNAVATVSKQLDAQKRVRSNGGSRGALRSEGYLILSGKYHRDIASGFGLPLLLADEYISVRVVPTDDSTGVLIGGRRWRRAKPGESVTEPAPHLKEKVNSSEGSSDGS
ncbi:NaeI family type II restriction endonuclease [Brevibacterium sp. CS2]|uniref:NaeI family type II restriction endonuclease n=1 Tax=Brevibacterium sp. CS2 TaxID=2575923 RepID=UPI0010C7DAEF|nr:NaeI family type II restriction endonuclease [Brevibacterium sp. CS2]QCP04452.1 restriction endonuclease [Brevibacterium sp. CS2]